MIKPHPTMRQANALADQAKDVDEAMQHLFESHSGDGDVMTVLATVMELQMAIISTVQAMARDLYPVGVVDTTAKS